MDIYSSMKIFHHHEHLYAIRNDKKIWAPVHVQIIPTNKCNQNCSFCAYRHGGGNKFSTRDQIPWAKLREIIEDCAEMGVKAIEITGGGEPTMHPKFIEIVRLISSRGVDVGIVTNGTSDKLLEAAPMCKWIRVSLDAATVGTYGRIRGVDQKIFVDVLNRIRKIAKMKKKPTLGLGFVATMQNYHELDYFVTHTAIECGADNVRISAVFNEDDHYDDDAYDEIVRSCQRAEVSTMKVFNLFKDRINDIEQRQPDYETCHFQKLCTYLGADMNLYRCCVLAYTERGLLGSVRDKDFFEIWENTPEKFANFKASDCQKCMFNNKNRMIAYAVAKDPPHVNFI